jgi:hypothetical protein
VIPRFQAAPRLHGPRHARHRRLGNHPPHPPAAPDRRPHRHPFGQRLRQGAGQRCRHRPEDFIVKPLKVNELLDWLGRKLGLEWVTADTPPPAPAPAEPPPLVAPAAEYVSALEEAINLGYLRGILNKLAEIEKLDARHGEFVRVLRELARQFQFDAMKEILRKSAR